MAYQGNRINDEETVVENKMDYIRVRGLTWERDSNGLFDYDSTKVFQSNFSFIKSCFLKRTKENLIAFHRQGKGQHDGLASVAFIKGNYYIDNFFPVKLEKQHKSARFNHKNWLTLRHFAPNTLGFSGYKMVAGDIIKVGRLVFGIRAICMQDGE